MITNFRDTLINGLLDRLARHARAPMSQRVFIVFELTHILSCDGRAGD